MSWREAWDLTRELFADPASRLGAALRGWEFGVSREWLLLADLFDLMHRANSDKPQRVKPYPRPLPDQTRRRRGNAGGRSSAEVIQILNAAREGAYEFDEAR